MRHVAVAAVVCNKTLFLVKQSGSKAWTLPMIELMPGEPAEARLKQEIDGVVSQVGNKSFEYFKRIDCLAPDNGETVSADIYYLDMGVAYYYQPVTDAAMWCYSPGYHVLSDVAWKTAQLLVSEKHLPLCF